MGGLEDPEPPQSCKLMFSIADTSKGAPLTPTISSSSSADLSHKTRRSPPPMSSKVNAVTFSCKPCSQTNQMNGHEVSRGVSGDAKLSSVFELPASAYLDADFPFPSVVPSPFSLSTVCSFLLSPPATSHPPTSGFCSLSPLAFLSITTNIKSKDVTSNCEGKLPARTASSLATALVSALQSFLHLEKPSFHLPKKLHNNFRLPGKQVRTEALHRLTLQSDATEAFKKVDFRSVSKERGSVQSLELENGSLNGRSLQSSILRAEQIGVVTVVDLEDENNLDGPGSIQKGRKTSAERVQNITKHLMAGAISTIIARTFVAPLERLKLEYIVRGAKGNWIEVIHGIWATEGFGGFWKGNTLNLLRMVPFKSLNFLAYDMFCKQMLERQGKEEVSNLDRLTAGAASGATATLLCFPLDTIRTRLIAPGGEALGGMFGCFQHMVHREGFFSLYKGLLPALLSMAPSGAVFYGVYDILKAAYLQSPKAQKELQRRIKIETEKRKASNVEVTETDENGEKNSLQLELGPVRTLIYGAIAGACAEAVTYPLEVVRRQLQLQQLNAKMGLITTFRGIIERDGLSALFAGVVPSTVQVLPSAALSFLVYESMKAILKVT